MLTAWERNRRPVPRSSRAAGGITLRPAWKNSMRFCRFSPYGDLDYSLRPCLEIWPESGLSRRAFIIGVNKRSEG